VASASVADTAEILREIWQATVDFDPKRANVKKNRRRNGKIEGKIPATPEAVITRIAGIFAGRTDDNNGTFRKKMREIRGYGEFAVFFIGNILQKHNLP
jgi:hypothetical protein